MMYEIALILLTGLLVSKICNMLKLPEVTGLLVVGVLIGPHVLGVLSQESVELLNPLMMIALTFISFQIGSELRISSLKRLGIKAFVISLSSSLLTAFLVTLGSLYAGFSLSFSVMLGVISSSTAPAAIMHVIKETRSKGKLTSNILGVVAIDDVISIIMFGLALTFVSTEGVINFLVPIKEIFLSILAGLIVGYLLGKVAKKIKEKSEMFGLVIVSLFLVIILSDFLHLSYMLTATVLGFTFINTFRYQITDKIIDITDLISPILTLIFFILSGASLNLDYLTDILFVSIVCIFFRTIGKVIGSYIGEKVTHFNREIGKYLGMCLLTQTGIAVGLATVAAPYLEEGKLLINIIILTSLVFDVVGSIVLKYSLKKMNEINHT